MAHLTWEQVSLVNPEGTLELGGEGEASSLIGSTSIFLLVKVSEANKSRFQPQGAGSTALSVGRSFSLEGGTVFLWLLENQATLENSFQRNSQ